MTPQDGGKDDYDGNIIKIICCLKTSVEIYYTQTPSSHFLDCPHTGFPKTVSEDLNIFKFHTPTETNLLRL
jgi:hypothetical protein